MRHFCYLACSSTFLLLGVALLSASEIPAPTGKVGVEGALAVSRAQPVTGEPFALYLNVTSLEAMPALTLRLRLPSQLDAPDTPLEQRFEGLDPGDTVTLSVVTTARRTGSWEVIGEAVLFEEVDYVESRSFVMVLAVEPAANASDP